MQQDFVDGHYEEKFEFPLLKMIKERAEKKDISYSMACAECIPEYVKTIRYRDTEFEDALIAERQREMAELAASEKVARELAASEKAAREKAAK